MRVLRTAALTAAVLAGTLAVGGPAAAATTGPKCPNQAEAPIRAFYFTSKQTETGWVDVYRVPNHLGFKLVIVNCR